ncbi:MAG: hypothetical protein WC384_08605 [Prolixibacteraceae bacterium]|jgi:membrane protein YdbS with pleckstrin-like domain
MEAQFLNSKSEATKFVIPLLTSIVITLFLFYIDEGFYNFNWMLNIGNWIVFLVYVSVIYGVQLLLILPLFRFAPEIILFASKFFLIILFVLFLTFIIFT